VAAECCVAAVVIIGVQPALKAAARSCSLGAQNPAAASFFSSVRISV